MTDKVPKSLLKMISNYSLNRIPVEDLYMLFSIGGKIVTEEKIRSLIGNHYNNLEGLEIPSEDKTLKQLERSFEESNHIPNTKDKTSKESLVHAKKVAKAKLANVQSSSSQTKAKSTTAKFNDNKDENREVARENVDYITKNTFLNIFNSLESIPSLNELKRDIFTLEKLGVQQEKPLVTEQSALHEAEVSGNQYNLTSNDLLVLKDLGLIDLNEGKSLKETILEYEYSNTNREAMKNLLHELQGDSPLTSQEIEELLDMMCDEDGKINPDKFVTKIDESIQQTLQSMKEVETALDASEQETIKSTCSSRISHTHSSKGANHECKTPKQHMAGKFKTVASSTAKSKK